MKNETGSVTFERSNALTDIGGALNRTYGFYT